MMVGERTMRLKHDCVASIKPCACSSADGGDASSFLGFLASVAADCPLAVASSLDRLSSRDLLDILFRLLSASASECAGSGLETFVLACAT